MPSESNKKDELEATEQEAAKNDETTEDLDFAELDLTVEAVEERISPSETNVFDK